MLLWPHGARQSDVTEQYKPDGTIIDKFVSVVPKWIPSQCVEMNDGEHAQQELALKVLQTFPRFSLMNNAAVKHFGRDQYRHVDLRTTRLCTPVEFYDAILEWALGNREFAPPVLRADQLRLARALGPRDPQIIEAVARTAFASEANTTEYPELKQDIRSLARTTLAEFGASAAPWSEQAYRSINADDALGTSAAQIAAATDYPGALEKTSKLLETILEQNPKDPIPVVPYRRFSELAYAVVRAGPAARPYAGPIIKILLHRKVEDRGYPFGIVSVSPRGMCPLLQLIGGSDAEKALSQAEEVCAGRQIVWP